MIEENATVVSIHLTENEAADNIVSNKITVESEIKSSCSGCKQVDNCGSGQVAKAFPQPKLSIDLYTDLPVKIGDTVVIGLSDKHLLFLGVGVDDVLGGEARLRRRPSQIAFVLVQHLVVVHRLHHLHVHFDGPVEVIVPLVPHVVDREVALPPPVLLLVVRLDVLGPATVDAVDAPPAHNFSFRTLVPELWFQNFSFRTLVPELSFQNFGFRTLVSEL